MIFEEHQAALEAERRRFYLSGGPFDGHHVFLSGAPTAVFTAGDRKGRYEVPAAATFDNFLEWTPCT